MRNEPGPEAGVVAQFNINFIEIREYSKLQVVILLFLKQKYVFSVFR